MMEAPYIQRCPSDDANGMPTLLQLVGSLLCPRNWKFRISRDTKWRRKWHDADFARVAQDLGRLCITWWGEFLLKFWEDKEFFLEMFDGLSLVGVTRGVRVCILVFTFVCLGRLVTVFWRSKFERAKSREIRLQIKERGNSLQSTNPSKFYVSDLLHNFNDVIQYGKQ